MKRSVWPAVLGMTLLCALAPRPARAAVRHRAKRRRAAHTAAARAHAKAAGHAPARPASKPKPAPAAGAAPGEALAPRPLSALVARLTPVESGPGVLVCEPVAVDADAGMADFGAGCARWLHLVVGGQGELGKTPMWGAAQSAQLELHRKDCRFTLPEAVSLSRSMGLTHVALGEIHGDARHGQLTYRCWRIPEKQPVGDPITVAGTQAEIIAGLPRLAAGLSQALGVRNPRVPEGVGEGPAELQSLGSLPWLPEGDYLTPEQVETLEWLAQTHAAAEDPLRPPHPAFLASFLDLIYRGSRNDMAGIAACGQRLTRLLPENTLAWYQWSREAYWTRQSEAAELPGGAGAPLKALSASAARFPHSFLVRAAQARFEVVGGQPAAGRATAEQAARCATRTPDAWLLLADCIFAQADAIRHARYVSDLTPEQLDECSRRYVEELPVIVTALQLDPDSFFAWTKLSAAAAFAGAGEVADRAFWKSVDLYPNFLPGYSWGLELYQPKWYGDEEKLAKVVRRAGEVAQQWNLTTRLQFAYDANLVAEVTGQTPLVELAQPLLFTDAERATLQASLERHRRALSDRR